MNRIAIILALAAGSLLLFGFSVNEKIKEFQRIIDNAIVNPINPKNVRIENDQLLLDLDIKITNPTAFAIDVDAKNLANITKIELLNKDLEVIAVGQSAITDFRLPGKSFTVIEGIPFTIPIVKALQTILSDIISGDITLDNISVRLTLEALGEQFIL